MKLDAFLNFLGKTSRTLFAPRLSRALLLHGVLAGAEHRRVLARELGTVVDIGANKGQFALAVRQWAPRARLIAFEPLAGPANIFRRVFAGDKRVALHQAAIGPAPARQLMHVSAREDSSSLLPIAAAQVAMFPGTQEKTTVEVRVATLDEWLTAADLAAPALLKLDVQGYELDALIGCEPLLPNFDWVYCECSYVEFYTGQKLAGDVADWLAAKGFQPAGTFNRSYDRAGNTVQADFLFRRAAP